ncbi:MAG: hypothetical protein VX542_06635 [Cyanobacteriota bacterium]|nr:hypothetical protein [Cyanobacteriota bacterium]
MKSIYQRGPSAEVGEKPTGSANLNPNLRGRASAEAEGEVRAAEAEEAERMPGRQPLRQSEPERPSINLYVSLNLRGRASTSMPI